jgi:hypothetical protein
LRAGPRLVTIVAEGPIDARPSETGPIEVTVFPTGYFLTGPGLAELFEDSSEALTDELLELDALELKDVLDTEELEELDWELAELLDVP